MTSLAIRRSFCRILVLLCIGLLSTCRNDAPQELVGAEEAPPLPPPEADYEPSERKWGYMDRRGRMAIEPQFDDCRSFSESRAVVRIGGKWGYIDEQGEIVIPIEYKGAWNFREGRGRVLTFQDSVGFVDLSGRWIIAPIWEEAQDFTSNRARVRREGKYGFVDRHGRLVIAPNYDAASSFDGRYAKVRLNGKYGIIDTSGRMVIPALYDRLGLPHQGLIRAQLEGKSGFLDTLGNWRIEPNFEAADDFYLRGAPVREGEKWALIDSAGQQITQFGYDQIIPGGDSLWIAERNGRYGALNMAGEEVIPFEFIQLYAFEEQRAPYSEDYSWGYIQPDGTIAIPAQYGLVYPFRNGLARVATADQGTGFINLSGRMVIRPRQGEVRDFSEGLAAVQPIN